MDNQHRKIAGYRELSQSEIDLMNKVKAKGFELEVLVGEVRERINLQRAAASVEDSTANIAEFNRMSQAEPERWASVARTHFQEGLMALTRAVAQPSSF